LIDIEGLVVRIFNHFTSAERIEELKTIFDFLGEVCENLLHHVGTRWLTLYPAIERLAKCWPAFKSYFLLLGGDDCPRQIWKYLEVCERGEAAGEETCDTVYCAFLKNALLPFQCTINELEQDNITALKLYPLMEKLRNKMSQRKEDMFIGEETEDMLLKLDEKISVSIKTDFLTFCDQSLKYLGKWFDFSNSNCLYKIQFLSQKKQPTYCDFKEVVVVLNLKMCINLGELYEEFYIIKPTLALFPK
jgi:hypothetical protein